MKSTDSSLCVNADAPNETLFCRKCGARIPCDSIFCQKCGCKVQNIIEDQSNAIVSPFVKSSEENVIEDFAIEKGISLEAAAYIINQRRKEAGMPTIAITPKKESTATITQAESSKPDNFQECPKPEWSPEYLQKKANSQGYNLNYNKFQSKPKKPKRSFFSDLCAVIGGIMLLFIILLFGSVILIAIVDGPESVVSKPSATSEYSPPVTTAPVLPDDTLKPHAKPSSGTINIGKAYNGESDSQITIHASYKDCVVKLKNAEGVTILSFFVRGGDTVTVGVPAGTLYAYFAEGTQWYGWSDRFGEDTIYSKDSQPLNFSEYTYEYTLYQIGGGNLTLSKIDSDEF